MVDVELLVPDCVLELVLENVSDVPAVVKINVGVIVQVLVETDVLLDVVHLVKPIVALDALDAMDVADAEIVVTVDARGVPDVGLVVPEGVKVSVQEIVVILVVVVKENVKDNVKTPVQMRAIGIVLLVVQIAKERVTVDVRDSVPLLAEDAKIVLEHVQLFVWELVEIIVMGVQADVITGVQ